MNRCWTKVVSGCISSLLILTILFFYGPVLLATLSLPIPSLAFSLPVSQQDHKSPNYQENPTISIPKLSVQAPIVRGVSLINRAEYDDSLKKGVALAKGSADLESSTGNTFLFGHSSNVSFTPTIYDSIFAGLPKLTEGDVLQISVAGRTSSYKVAISKVIGADQIEYLHTDQNRVLTLVTCWPLGTNFKRWVVQASRVD